MSTFRDVSGKVAFVTGAARGLGKGIAETLAREGVHVVMADKLPLVEESFQEISKASPDNQGHAVVLDVSDEQAFQAAIEGAVKKLGKLDIMVNNAGMHMDTGNVRETDAAKLDRIMAVNFKGTFFGCKYASRQMVRQKSGSIINIGSFFGKVGLLRRFQRSDTHHDAGAGDGSCPLPGQRQCLVPGIGGHRDALVLRRGGRQSPGDHSRRDEAARTQGDSAGTLRLAVTGDGYRMLSKFPSAKLISCPCVGSVLP